MQSNHRHRDLQPSRPAAVAAIDYGARKAESGRGPYPATASSRAARLRARITPAASFSYRKAHAMQQRNLGRSGLKVSVVGLGCNNFGGSRLDLQASRKVI